jgi:N-acetylmuramoyl-L-alanine amidase
MPRLAAALLLIFLLAWGGLASFAGWSMLHQTTHRAAADEPLAIATSVQSDAAGAERANSIEPARAAASTATAPRVSYAAPDYAPSADGLPVGAAPAGLVAQPGQRRNASKGVVVLDPGHGRGDPGAVHYLPDGSGRWDITEADSNLHNAELIRDRLVALGYDVYLTREGAGRGPDGPLPLEFISSDLVRRVQLARAVDADVYLALHGNGATVHEISGPETWYCGKHQDGAANERLALMVQQATVDALHEYGYDPPDRGIKEDAEQHHLADFCEFVVTRESPVPAALLEFLFLTNDDDAKVLVDDRAHELLADHVAHAIDAFVTERRAAQP